MSYNTSDGNSSNALSKEEKLEKEMEEMKKQLNALVYQQQQQMLQQKHTITLEQFLKGPDMDEKGNIQNIILIFVF